MSIAEAPERTGTRTPALTAEEREAVLVWNDADQSWSLHCDSRTLGGALQKWLARLGITLEQRGAGFQAEGIPRKAVRFAAPRRASASRMAALARAREAAQDARVASSGPVRIDPQQHPAPDPD